MGKRPKPPKGTSNNIPKPSGLTVTSLSPTSVYLTWMAVPNATTYWIYRNGYVPAIISGITYIDNAVTGGTSYSYAVAAVVNGVLGPASDLVTITTEPATGD